MIPEPVAEPAEVLEHAISDLMLSRIDAKLGHPKRDPHGDPIPSADGVMVRPDARRLSLLEPGETGVIARDEYRVASLFDPSQPWEPWAPGVACERFMRELERLALALRSTD